MTSPSLDPQRRLIVNADDFGATPGISDGIAEAARDGIVTASSVMVNLGDLDEARRIAAQVPTLDLGLHLNLSWGHPLSEGPSSLAPGGRLRGKRGTLRALLSGRIRSADLEREISAQGERFKQSFGPPSHVDVHQHLHLAPRLWRVLLAWARREGVPFMRRPAELKPRGLTATLLTTVFRTRRWRQPPPRRTDAFLGLSATGSLDRAQLQRYAALAPQGLTELMVHPGYGGVDGVGDQLGDTREGELRALVDPAVRRALEEHQIVLTTFRDEAAPRASTDPA